MNSNFEIKLRKKLIDISIPLDAINKASAKEKSIRYGHPNTLHLWWARRPLAASRAVIFGINESEVARFDTNGHFIPSANNTRDLGTSSTRWRNLYTNDLNLSNEGGANDVDGTCGSYTIQEGVEDLFLINNRSGKKYKFNLTEVA